MKISAQKLFWMTGLTLLLGFLVYQQLAARAAVSVELDGWRIEAGPVEARKISGKAHNSNVSGSYRLKTNSQPAGNRLAGACLVANLTHQGIGLESCDTDQQCNDAYLAQQNPSLPGAHLYCLGAKAGGVTRQCWTRPGPDTEFCVKGPHAPGMYTVPVAGKSLSADPLDTGEPVDWRVLGCLNPAVFQGMPPCANPESKNKVYAVGPVRKVTP